MENEKERKKDCEYPSVSVFEVTVLFESLKKLRTDSFKRLVTGKKIIKKT